jgi:hypothetical protein
MTTTTTPTWNPTAEKVEAILVTMRPLIDRCVDRDARFIAACGSRLAP